MGAGESTAVCTEPFFDGSRSNLEEIPAEILTFDELERLELQGNKLKTLPKRLFRLTSLRYIDVSDNEISEIPTAIGHLINCEQLFLNRNAFTEVPESVELLPKLHYLDISSCPIEKLPDGLGSCLALRHLILNDVYIEDMPESLGNLSQLEVLEVRDTQLCEVPDCIFKLSNLRRLDLGNNRITEIPSFIDRLSALRDLSIDLNGLTELPEELCALSKLAVLDFSGNGVEELPYGFCKLTNLVDLSMTNNQLSRLPDDIGALSKLSILHMERNSISNVPTSIGRCTLIEEIMGASNAIEVLPEAIGELSLLHCLCLDDNKLSTLPDEIGHCKRLSLLSVRDNELKTLPASLGNLKKLAVLNVVGNRLLYLPHCLTALPRLTAIWLSDNQSKPLVPFQKDSLPDGDEVLTNYMLPQSGPRKVLDVVEEVDLSEEEEESDGMIQSYSKEPGSRVRARQSMITFEPGEDDSSRAPSNLPKDARNLAGRSEATFLRRGSFSSNYSPYGPLPCMTQGTAQGARTRHSFIEGMDNQEGDILEQLANAAQPKKSQWVSGRKQEITAAGPDARSPSPDPPPRSTSYNRVKELNRNPSPPSQEETDVDRTSTPDVPPITAARTIVEMEKPAVKLSVTDAEAARPVVELPPAEKDRSPAKVPTPFAAVSVEQIAKHQLRMSSPKAERPPVQAKPPSHLIRPAEVDRVQTTSPPATAGMATERTSTKQREVSPEVVEEIRSQPTVVNEAVPEVGVSRAEPPPVGGKTIKDKIAALEHLKPHSVIARPRLTNSDSVPIAVVPPSRQQVSEPENSQADSPVLRKPKLAPKPVLPASKSSVNTRSNQSQAIDIKRPPPDPVIHHHGSYDANMPTSSSWTPSQTLPTRPASASGMVSQPPAPAPKPYPSSYQTWSSSHAPSRTERASSLATVLPSSNQAMPINHAPSRSERASSVAAVLPSSSQVMPTLHALQEQARTRSNSGSLPGYRANASAMPLPAMNRHLSSSTNALHQTVGAPQFLGAPQISARHRPPDLRPVQQQMHTNYRSQPASPGYIPNGDVHQGQPYYPQGVASTTSTVLYVDLLKKESLGFSVTGGIDGGDNPFDPSDPGVFVTEIFDDTVNYLNGRLQLGDKLLSVDYTSLEGYTHNDAVDLLRRTAGRVRLKVCRRVNVHDAGTLF